MISEIAVYFMKGGMDEIASVTCVGESLTRNQINRFESNMTMILNLPKQDSFSWK